MNVALLSLFHLSWSKKQRGVNPACCISKAWCRHKSSQGSVLQSSIFLATFPVSSRPVKNAFKVLYSILLADFSRQTENNVNFPKLNIFSTLQLQGHLERKQFKTQRFFLRSLQFLTFSSSHTSLNIILKPAIADVTNPSLRLLVLLQ